MRGGNGLARNRVPLNRVATQHNIAGTWIAFFIKTVNIAYLACAAMHAWRELEIFAQVGADHYVNDARQGLQGIDGLCNGRGP